MSDNAVYLFQEEYKLSLIDPVLAAHLGAFAQHLFPILLAIGLASRFAALALFGMTLVIEIFSYPDAWPTHGVRAACFLLVIARGPGSVSVDYLIARHYAAMRPAPLIARSARRLAEQSGIIHEYVNSRQRYFGDFAVTSSLQTTNVFVEKSLW